MIQVNLSAPTRQGDGRVWQDTWPGRGSERLINNEDIRAVEKTISYLDKVSFGYLPILPTGTCILAGLLANVPVVVDIDSIEPKKHEPKNKTITLTDKWN